ncbi:S8 family serine peptidase [Streptomyces sp. NPDC004134]|uniref:S8 family peptidase n=1 Tax=Streptomyces sp. NPDC004134 TaxID=3364691 RepID=UPI0036A1476C
MSTSRSRVPRRARSRRRLVIGVAVTALATGMLTPVASQAAAGNGSENAPAAAREGEVVPVSGARAGSWRVTLVTGDTVQVGRDASGRFSVTADPQRRPDGHVPTFETYSGPEGTFVIPDDAQAAVRAGILERKLFDVAYLAQNGFADAKAEQLPLVLSYRGDAPQASVARTARELPAAGAPLSLDSLHGAAVKVDKGDAERFWEALRGKLPAPGTSARAPKALAGGVAKVWLDDKVEAVLDESVPLVGAPEAWKNGLDGAGVTVAVLDTGVDATHPDLAGKIAAGKSFITGEEVVDGHGHGTHVASTIAGSGAASGGSHKGVAPGAKLAVGKVLSNAGSGSTSQIVAGMEWATKEAGAKVVSMSLGSSATDGSDPLSRSVDELTRSTDSLFVIAAGNDGPGKETVSAPGTADSALTVAATDKSDGMADFSSRGPRFGDGALKPDIAAPGVGIAAARAAGTSMGTPVDDNYTSAGGTSMATPHVAGAAAVLAQQHPDWSWSRLKTALMSTSKDAGHTPADQGAGRLDVARATGQQVTATTGAVDYGTVEFSENDPLDRTITYANDGDTDVTLSLATEFGGKAAGPLDGRLTTGGDTVTVPAHATADVTVTADPGGLEQDAYYGSVVATDGGGNRVSTAVNLQRQPKKVLLSVKVLDRKGNPADPQMFSVSASAVDVPEVYSQAANSYGDGTAQFLVQPGTWSVSGSILGNTEDGGPGTSTQLYEPEVTVGENGAEVTLDARKAVRLQYRTPRPHSDKWEGIAVQSLRTAWDGTPIFSGGFGLFQGERYFTPTKKVTKGEFLFSTRTTLTNLQLDIGVTSPARTPLDVHTYGKTDGTFSMPRGEYTPFPEGRYRKQVADVGMATPEDIAGADLKGKVALLMMSPDPEDGANWGCYLYNDRIQQLKDAGATGVLLYAKYVHQGCSVPTGGVEGQRVPLPVGQILPDQGQKIRSQLERGPVTVRIDSNPDIDYVYNLLRYEDGQIPANLTYTYKNNQLATVQSRFHQTNGSRYTTEAWHSHKPLEIASFAVGSAFTSGRERPLYLGGLYSDALRTGQVQTVQPNDNRSVATVVDRPVRTELDWLSTPLTPGWARGGTVPGVGWKLGCSFCVQGDLLLPTYERVIGDGTESGTTVANTNVTVTRDGVELERVKTPLPIEAFRMPKGEGTYQIRQSGAGMANTWTFRSRVRDEDTTGPNDMCFLAQVGNTGPCNPQPLVFVGYDLSGSLSLDSTVPAGRKHTFTVDVRHPESTERMPEIAGLKLGYSTDDGATWQNATVRKRGEGDYAVTLTYPALAGTSGSVSLRAEAWDEDGNRVEQTSSKAITLR